MPEQLTTSREPDTSAEQGGGGESVTTVIVAGLANLAIAVAKTVAGLLSGSAAMLSEAAHSFADTTTEVLLYVALRRGDKPPDDKHPFGYGKESFVWAFLAALFTFVAGAGFSITRGISTIRHGEEGGDFTVSYIVLAISFVLEGVSFLRTIRQVRGEAQRWNTTGKRFLRLTPDTTVKAVFLEDSAALTGLLFAAAGLIATQTTGKAFYDGLSSIGIGCLLLIVVAVLTRSNISLLVGQAVPARLHREIAEEINGLSTVMAVPTLLTMQLGLNDILVAAKVDFADNATGAQIEAASDEVETRLTRLYPSIRFVFLDPTGGAAGRIHRDGGVD